MTLDLSTLDAKIRKFQKLKELLSDAETRDLLADPEVRLFIQETVRGNGSLQSLDKVAQPEGQKPKKLLRPGTLLAEVFNTTTDLNEVKGNFTVKDVVERMQSRSYKFAAKNREIAVNSSLVKLAEAKLIRVVTRGKGRRAGIFGHAKPPKTSAA
jgi:hypothetical protein